MRQAAIRGVKRIGKVMLSDLTSSDGALADRLRALELGLRELRLTTVRNPAFAPLYDARARLRSHEAKVYSQNGEDGLLLHLFSRIGVATRTFFEFGVQTGRECNSAHLSIHLGWSGTLIEGDPELAAAAREYYASRTVVRDGLLTIVPQFVTTENIDGLVREHAGGRDLDLLSIDIDGNDYWVWRAVESVRPRVVVVEYNAHLGPDRSLTVEYDPAFRRRAKHPSGFYFGASLSALARLAGQKGYVLAGCDSKGVNAFFVRDDLAGAIEALTPAQAYYRLSSGTAVRPPPEQAFAQVSHMPWVVV